MKALTTILGLLLALILHKGYCQERITLSPVSMVAALKATASFTCGAKDASPSWTIDGKSSSREDIKRRGITEISTPPDANGTSISTLTVPATAENNGSVIVCVAYNIMVLRSENVTLLVQGILEQPSNVSISVYNDFNQILTWTPPYTLDITDLDPDITYRVYNNVTNTHMDTSDTSYTVPTTCVPVEYGVSACNPAGCGENGTAEFRPSPFVQKPSSVSLIGNPEFVFNYAISEVVVPWAVLLKFEVDGNCTGVYTADFAGEYGGSKQSALLPIIPIQGMHYVTCTGEDGVEENDRYSGTITMDALSTNVAFSTFDVQEVNINSERKEISCTFANGSLAEGCRIVVELDGDDDEEITVNATRERIDGTLSSMASANFSVLQNQTYTVRVFDIEVDGSFNTRVATVIGAVAVSPTSVIVSSMSPSETPGSGGSTDDANIVAVAGAVVAGVVVTVVSVIIIAIVCFVYHTRKKKRRKASSSGQQYEMKPRTGPSPDNSMGQSMLRVDSPEPSVGGAVSSVGRQSIQSGGGLSVTGSLATSLPVTMDNIKAIVGDPATQIFDGVMINSWEQVITRLEETGEATPADRIRLHFANNEAALRYSSKMGFLPIVEQLLEEDVDISACDEQGQNALMKASAMGHTRVVELLLRKITREHLNTSDNYQSTALHMACGEGHNEVVELLLQHEADFAGIDKGGQTPLMKAAWSNHLEVVRLLVGKGADVNQLNENGETAVFFASHGGHLNVVELLIEKGSDVTKANNRGQTPLMKAAFKGHYPVIELLIKEGADVDTADEKGTALVYASHGGHSSVVELLIGRKADLNVKNERGRTALMFASESGHWDVAKLLIEKGSRVSDGDQTGRTALMLASENGHQEIVELLIDKGASVTNGDQRGENAIMYAIRENKLHVIELLLTKEPQVLESVNKVGQTPLMLAAWCGHEEALKLLIGKKANVNARCGDSGETALMHASSNGLLNVAKLLYTAEAEVNAQDKDDETALMKAAKVGDVRMVKRLVVRAGARLDLTDKKGRTARDIAEKNAIGTHKETEKRNFNKIVKWLERRSKSHSEALDPDVDSPPVSPT